ncbi:hypothetical protein LSH36_297g02012, partial [Paralvinella palmiformis]
HLNYNHLSNVFQSAYKQFNSTKTTLLKVHKDIALNMDTGKVTTLTLLDLSATFDTIDYSVLLDRLSDWYGILTQHLDPLTIKIRKCFSKAVLTFSQPQIRPSFICR